MIRLAPIAFVLSGAMFAGHAFAGEWTAPVEVRSDDKLCLSYRAAWNGEFLIVETNVEPGWHTFSMDNKHRQREKLAGKTSLGIERETSIHVTRGLDVSGPWLQSPPKDFSKPEIRWYTWGYDRQAVFAVKAKRAGTEPGQLEVKGQACTDTICKNIDATVVLPLREITGRANVPALDSKTLVRVTTP